MSSGTLACLVRRLAGWHFSARAHGCPPPPRQVLPEADQGQWLPGGGRADSRSLRSIDLHVLDMTTSERPHGEDADKSVRVPKFDLPGRSIAQVNVLARHATPVVLTAYTPQLEKLWSLRLPETDNPDATRSNELAHNHYNVAPTIDGAPSFSGMTAASGRRAGGRRDRSRHRHDHRRVRDAC